MPGCPAGDIKDHSFFSTVNWDKIETKQVPPPFKPSVVSILKLIVLLKFF